MSGWRPFVVVPGWCQVGTAGERSIGDKPGALPRSGGGWGMGLQSPMVTVGEAGQPFAADSVPCCLVGASGDRQVGEARALLAIASESAAGQRGAGSDEGVS